MPVTQKKKTFKQRLRQNDLKLRHKISSQMRDRMGSARRRYNRFDRVDDGGRPLDEIVDEIAEGSAVPVQETLMLDPRSLTNLLLTADSSSRKGRTDAASNQSTSPSAAPTLRLSETPLPADHPLAIPDSSELEAADQQTLEAEQQRTNKNQYRHHGQPYVFWERSGLHPLLQEALRSMKFTHPTPTQAEVLPPVLEMEEKRFQRERQLLERGDSEANATSSKKLAQQDKDVLISAETGSGKTLVFALPILQRLVQTVYAIPEEYQGKGSTMTSKRQRDERSAKTGGKKLKTDDGIAKETPPEVALPKTSVRIGDTLWEAQPEDPKRRLMHSLVLSPTRELALQIHQIFRQLCQHAPAIRVGCIVGGMAAEKQQRILNQQPHVLICTPGRLWELVQKNEGCYLGHSISRRLQCVVLDEADRMLHAGRSFEELKQLLDRIHCEILPAGFVQEREEGAETGEHEELEAGIWDAKQNKFVSFAEANKRTGTETEKPSIVEERRSKKKDKSKKAEVLPSSTTKSKKTSDLAEEENGAAPNPPRSKSVKKKRIQSKANKKKKSRRDEESEEEFEETLEGFDDESEEEEEEYEVQEHHRGQKKDEPRPMPMPAEPLAHHRVITFVTSATLSLQTNYERRDYSARKSVIRTTNADVMGKVLQELSIKSSNALIFNVVASDSGVAAKVCETYLRCPDESKDLYMYYFLKTYAKKERTIVFVNAISMLRRLVKLIEILGISVVGLHASMQQRQRLKFIDRFKKGDIKVLVATDVASRGLDIDDVRYVLHFQVPRSTDSYIHRCGRTARCGSTGLSLLLVNAAEHMSFRKLLESTGRKESDLETFALQPTVVHQLHAHLRITLQIDKLQKEITKSRAKNTWVSRMSKQAEIDASDMIDDEADEENRQKTKAIKALSKELQLLQRKFTGAGGKGAFRTGSHAIGAKLAEEKLTQRAQRQTFLTRK